MWERTPPSVGASLLAKNSQAPRSFRKYALSLTFFASKLAPTESLKASPLLHLNGGVSGACNFSIGPMTFSFAQPPPPVA
ncbi:hypothetical protein CUU62_03550 [Pseudomonas sp. WP001]|nr:hypothetical protein CUU62_03550 [Pseudomonas sp. WP001]